MTRLAAALLLWALVCLPQQAEAQDPSVRSLLLFVEASTESTFVCQGGRSQYHVYRDGLVVVRSDRDEGLTSLERMLAPEDAVRDLKVALAENEVGFAEGDCIVPQQNPESFFTAAFVWFGRGDRQHAFSVATQGWEACPGNTEAIVDAFLEFLGQASLDPDGELEQVPYNPPPPCGSGT